MGRRISGQAMMGTPALHIVDTLPNRGSSALY